MVRHQSVGSVVRMVREVLSNPVGVANSQNRLAKNSGCLAGYGILYRLRLDRAGLGWAVDPIEPRVVGYRLLCNQLGGNASVRTGYMATTCGPVRLGVQRPRKVRSYRNAHRNTCFYRARG